MKYNLTQASKLEGVPSLSTLKRHIKNGKISINKDEFGKTVIDVSELVRVYKIKIKTQNSELEDELVHKHDITYHEPSKTNYQIIGLKAELKATTEQKDFFEQQLEDLRKERNAWREQAKILLLQHEKKTPKGFWSRLTGLKSA